MPNADDLELHPSIGRMGAVVAALVAVVIGVVALVQLAGIAGDLSKATDRLEECNTPAPPGVDPRGRCFEEDQARARAYVAHLDAYISAVAFCSIHHTDVSLIRACAANNTPPPPEPEAP